MKTNATNSSVKKPKWLRKLEQESWQAELLISGAAILGAFQIPGLIGDLEEFLLLHARDFTLSWASFVFIYLKGGVNVLILIFIYHFVIRSLWIGLVGLNSVYPDGFYLHERFSADYQSKLLTEFGDIDGYIQRLDAQSSSIFGVGFAGAFILINLSLTISILVGIATLIDGLGEEWQWLNWVLIVLLGVATLLYSLNALFHSPRFQELPLVKKIHYPITQWFTRLTSPIYHKYIYTTLNLVTSYYANTKGYWLKIFLLSSVFGFAVGMSTLGDQRMRYFSSERYHRTANYPSELNPANYADQQYQGLYYAPVIPSLRIEDTTNFWVWIPLPAREWEHVIDQCSALDAEVENDEFTGRQQKKRRNLRCAQEYLTVTINKKRYSDFDLREEYRTASERQQYGVRLTFPNINVESGYNELKIISAYPHPETGKNRIARVGFYY